MRHLLGSNESGRVLIGCELIEGDDGLTLIDTGFPGKEAGVFRAIRGLGRSLQQLEI